MVKSLSWCIKALYCRSLKGFCFFLILLLIFTNCQEGELFKEDDAIEKAKAWFERNEALLRSRNSSKGRTGSSNFFEKHPDWSKSMVHNTSNGFTAVEVGLEYDNYLIVTESELTNTSDRPNVINSLILFKLESGNYTPYLKFSQKTQDYRLITTNSEI